MRTIALAIALVVGLILPAFAQKAEIEAVNAKWIDFFNKGDFAGVASLYTDDATAFPPGSGMVKGRAAIEALWKSMAEQVSDPKLITLDVNKPVPRAHWRGPQISRGRALGVAKNVMKMVAGADHIGELQAWNVDTGKKVWTTNLPSFNWGTVLATGADR